MPSAKGTAMAIAEELLENGRCVITASEARSKVKDNGMKAPWESKIESGFKREGWVIDDDTYYQPAKLSERTMGFSERLRAESRVVVSRSIVSREVANMDRLEGEWGEKVDENMQEQGWEIDEQNGIYYLPVTELVSESSLGYYLLNSFSLSN